MALERIQKILSRAGIASRREAERMVLEGRVTVNGKVVEQLGFKADPLKDHIRVDGKRLGRLETSVVLLVNKPKGYVSTVRDPEGRPTIIDLVKGVKQRVYPVGRLDIDAEGLVILTNDGELANLLTHPRYQVPRSYLAKVSGVPDEKDLKRLRRGITLEDGKASATSVSLMRLSDKNSWLRIVVTEGRNHLVKRMLFALGHSVLKLKRIGFGPLRLGTLPPGQSRYLTSEELNRLKKYVKELKKKSGQRRELPDTPA